jgi:UDP-N-acetylglucosamine 1-carboxyvinyltransferase
MVTKQEKYVQHLSKLISDLRKHKKLSQSELASELNTAQSAVSKLENNDRLPNISTLLKLAKATNTELVIKFVNKKKRK